MDIDYLVRMANDIGAFFASEDDETLAATSIHQHLKRFWDQRMKSRIVAHYAETGGLGLEGAVRVAVRKLSEEQSVAQKS